MRSLPAPRRITCSAPLALCSPTAGLPPSLSTPSPPREHGRPLVAMHPAFQRRCLATCCSTPAAAATASSGRWQSSMSDWLHCAPQTPRRGCVPASLAPASPPITVSPAAWTPPVSSASSASRPAPTRPTSTRFVGPFPTGLGLGCTPPHSLRHQTHPHADVNQRWRWML